MLAGNKMGKRPHLNPSYAASASDAPSLVRPQKAFAKAAEFQIVRKQYAALRDRKFKDDFISRAWPLLQYVNHIVTCGA